MDQIKIGKFIYQLRKEKNLTQEELAIKLGTTSKSISRWETGKTMPDYNILKELCSILNITISELLNGEKIEVEEQQEKLDNTLYNILGEYDKIEKKKKQFKRFIFIIGLIFITLVVRLLIGVGSIFLLTSNVNTYDISDITTYETYLKELKSHKYYDVHTGLEIFPENINQDNVLEYSSLYREGLFDGSYSLLLALKYEESEFNQEIIRLQNIYSTNEYYKGTFSNNGPYFEKKYILYTEDGFKYPAYITVYENELGEYEYALIDKDNKRIIYVLNQLYSDAPINGEYKATNYTVPDNLKDSYNGYDMYSSGK